MVTVFGDLAQQETARISGQALNHLARLIGLKPEAVRVALHRLRKDGWIDSQRSGRTSAYHLTPFGRARSAEASPLIYAKSPQAQEAWLVLTDPALPAMEYDGTGAWLTANTLIAPAEPTGEGVYASLIGPEATLPGWMTARICAPELARQSRDLVERLRALREQLEQHSLSPPQIAALRVLVVHSWRRVALKAPDLPGHVFPKDWAGQACRDLVADLLAQLPAQRLNILEQSVSETRRTG
nr:PaaX family transcriptional regulator C-terminal domain-containing protein [Aestuariivita sp.]